MRYQEPGKRPRDEYHLTPAGDDLLMVVLAMTQWGDKHLQQTGRGPLTFTDRQSGNAVCVVVTDATQAATIAPRDVEIRRT